MLYNGVFTLFDWLHFFCMIHSIGAINVCTNFEIKIYEFIKHTKIVGFIWRHAKTVVMVARILMIDISMTVTFDLCYIFSRALGMKYWDFHAKFHENRSSINGWHAVDTHTHTNTHKLKVKSSLANPFGARLISTKLSELAPMLTTIAIFNQDNLMRISASIGTCR